MNKEEIENILKNFGVNSRLRGFDYLVKLIIYIIEDIKKNKITSKNYNMNDYYIKLSNDFDVSVSSIPANINTCVKSNLYGNGLTPKDAINLVLQRYEWKEGNNK